MLPNYHFITIEIYPEYAEVVLNRPDKRNALHHDMVKELLSGFYLLQHSSSLRAILIRAEGQDFSSGADLNWMKTMAAAPFLDNVRDAESLAELLHLIYTYSKPVIALAHGTAMGGALGILAAADIVYAADNARFGLPEVKLGLIPAIISPYLLRAIGTRWSRYFCLTGELFSAATALQLNFIHRMVSATTLYQEGVDLINRIAKNSPTAVSLTKNLIRKMSTEPINMAIAHDTAALLARVRMSPEANEGIQSFLEKRMPNWGRSE